MRVSHIRFVAAAAAFFVHIAASRAETFGNEADLVAAVMPSFVNVYNRGVAAKMTNADGTVDPAIRVKDEVGSGFIVDPSGIIVTNRHVVEGAYALSVTLSDGTHVPATLLGKALTFDIALIKIDLGKPLPVAKLGDSGKLRIGDRVVAIGNPLGFAGSASSGIISAFHRNVGLSAYDDLIQTDATINQGNSGGPLFNMSGEVIGINQAIYTRNEGGSIGIGFSIPINDAKFLVDSVLKNGKPRFGWLGVQAQALSPEMAKVVGLKGQGGVIVSGVTKGGPAESAGLQIGDVILKIGGESVASTSSLNRVVFHSFGQTKALEILRDGAIVTLPADIKEWPQEAWAMKFEDQPKLNTYADFGVNFADSPEGPLVKSVVEKSVAWSAGLRAGDVVKRVKSTPVHTVDELGSVIDDMFTKQGIKSALMLLEGPNGTRWIDVSVAE